MNNKVRLFVCLFVCLFVYLFVYFIEITGIPIPLPPTSQDTISSTLSGASGPRDVPSPTNTEHTRKGAINKQKIYLFIFSHSLVFILGLFIGGRYLLNRRLSL